MPPNGPQHPTRCPSCRRPSRRSHACCVDCTRRHGSATANLLARVQADPQFTAALLAQVRPEQRERIASLVMAQWLQRRGGDKRLAR